MLSRTGCTTHGCVAFLIPKGKRLTSRAEQLRQTIEELGPTFVKFGQIVADRPDLASDHLREELKKLQSNARPMDDGEAISLIETGIRRSY
jgi:ubiquinone biosynthesis protein